MVQVQRVQAWKNRGLHKIATKLKSMLIKSRRKLAKKKIVEMAKVCEVALVHLFQRKIWCPFRSLLLTHECSSLSCILRGAWRNGSASDSRSEGWELESL